MANGAFSGTSDGGVDWVYLVLPSFSQCLCVSGPWFLQQQQQQQQKKEKYKKK